MARPTIIDVARLAGVSKTTVSRVVNGELDKVSPQTAEKVTQAILSLGYEQNAIASSLRTDRTNLIMFAIPDINNPFWPEVARGVQDYVEQHGYAVVFANNDWDAQREISYLKIARKGRFDGILINPISVKENDLRGWKIPTVILGNRKGYESLDSVASDSYNATLAALAHLYGLGHRRIAMLSGIPVVSNKRLRERAFHDFLKEKDLPENEALMLKVSYDHQGGAEGMQRLLQLPHPPSAVLASNDVIAIGAMHTISDFGCHIPGDISIIGIDGIYAASATIPALTTVVKQKYEMGATAAEILLKRIQRSCNEPVRHVYIACKLDVRGTTGPAPALAGG